MEQNKSDEFYTEISKALLGFISNKTNVEEVYLSTDKIKNMFNDLMSKDALNEIINTIEVCESVRYAPGLYVTDMHTTYQSALKIITQLEEALK